MRQFIYLPEHAGLREWPSGLLRLDGIEKTEDPSAADIFVCPGNIRIFEASPGVLDHQKLYRLPFISGNEHRTVFLDVSDNFTKPVNLPILFIKCDARTWMLPHDPNTIQMAWPVEDYRECVVVPEGGFKYDISFQGWLSSDARKQSFQAFKWTIGLNCDFAGYKDFCGYIYDQPEGIRRRQEFRRSMRESRIALCPESIPGVLPYRFFEAMSAGRVPLLVSSDYVLPFDDEIPYGEFILHCPSAEASKAGQIATEFLQSHFDEQIIEMGRKARRYWQQFLDCRLWPRTMAYAVEKKMRRVAA